MAATKEQNAAYSREVYRATQTLADTYLDECVDCGEDDPLVLEFDHVFGEPPDRGTYAKRRSITSRGIKAFLAEVRLCEVRCANCHKRRHGIERLVVVE